MKKYVRLLPLAGLMLVGCAQSAQQEQVTAEATSSPTPSGAVSNGERAVPAEVPLARLLRATGHPVIYQGTLELEVADFNAASSALDSVLMRRGAYLTTAHETTSEERHEQALTIQVPSGQFLALTAELARLGIVHSKNLTSRDIATELAQLRQTPQPNPRPATAATDTALDASWRTQEQLLLEQATLATLNLSYYQLRPSEEVSPAAALAPRLAAGIRFGWQLVSAVLIGAAYLWPVLLALGSWAWLHWRRRLQNRVV